MPWDEIEQRGFELPPRSTPLLVCCEDSTEFAAELTCWFSTRTKAWEAVVLPVTKELFQTEKTESGPSPFGYFLFRPSPLIEDSAQFLQSLLDQNPGALALDIGCGSGREAIILATTGWSVFGLDRDRRALKRWIDLADRQGCRSLCTPICANLEKEGDLRSLLSSSLPERFHLILVNRHLHRPTLSDIVLLMAPGALLLFHTFLDCCEHPPDTKHKLRSGELKETFGTLLNIERDEELPIEDGRVMSFFVARKPAESEN